MNNLQAFLQAYDEMRRAQQAFFRCLGDRTKSKEYLIAAKRAEAEADAKRNALRGGIDLHMNLFDFDAPAERTPNNAQVR